MTRRASDRAGDSEDQAATRLVKRSVAIAGHRTSVSLEEAFWQALKEIAARRNCSMAALVACVDKGRGSANLSSALRVHVFAWSRRREATEVAFNTREPDQR